MISCGGMTPHQITPTEWAEIRDFPGTAEAFWLNGSETPGDLADQIYGVRFDYQTDGPGYAGDLFLLKGGGSPTDPAINLYRDPAGHLVLAES